MIDRLKKIKELANYFSSMKRDAEKHVLDLTAQLSEKRAEASAYRHSAEMCEATASDIEYEEKAAK